MKKSNLTKIVSCAVAGVLAVGALTLAGCGDKDAATDTTKTTGNTNIALNDNANNAEASNTETKELYETVVTEADPNSPYSTGKHTVVMTVEGYDPITINLDADTAPVTVYNFMTLVDKGYYDGLSFYRFQDDFCLQGGTAGNTASGMDPNLQPIIGEFESNGVDNELANNFQRGIVAMARTTDPDSATSTFFVTLDSSDAISLSLDGQYAAFGSIDDAGMEVIDKIMSDYQNVEKDQMGVVGQDDLAYITSIEIVQ